jgi:hypothetical protein
VQNECGRRLKRYAENLKIQGLKQKNRKTEKQKKREKGNKK